MNAVCRGHDVASGDERSPAGGAPLSLDLEVEERQPRVGVLGRCATHDEVCGLGGVETAI